MKPFRLSDPAAAELTEAIRWSEHQRAGLGAELLEAIGDTVDLIRTHPEIGAPRTTRRSSRQLRVNRFPYQRRVSDPRRRYLRRGICLYESTSRLLEASSLIRSASRFALSRGVQRCAEPSAPARWAVVESFTASYSVSGATSAPFGHTTVPPSTKNRWK